MLVGSMRGMLDLEGEDKEVLFVFSREKIANIPIIHFSCFRLRE